MAGDRRHLKVRIVQDDSDDESPRPEMIIMSYMDVVNSLNFGAITSLDYFEATRREPMRDIYPEIQEIDGDLFTVDQSWAFAYSVSEDLEMPKGIAASFRERFNNLDFIREQNILTGHVGVLHHIEPNDGHGRFIFYLVTKTLFYHRSCFFNVYCCLYRLRQICEALNVNQVAMPRIGSGRDHLQFNIVRHLIHLVFKGSLIRIRIYSVH